MSPAWNFVYQYQTLNHCLKSVRIRSYSGPYFPDSDWIRTRITWIRALFTQWMSSWYFEFKYENLILKLKLHWIWSKLKIYKCKDLGFGKRNIFLNIMNPVRHSSVSLAKLPLNHYFIFTVLLFDLTSGTFIFKKIP